LPINYSIYICLINILIYYIIKDNSEDGTENLTDPCKHDEKWYVILLEVLFPFLIAGFGMVCAGVVLDIVQVILSILII
jgi:hypothetical protein